MNTPLLLDGAMGTALIDRGLRPGAQPDLWNLERPMTVIEVHGDYRIAGAELVTTNSFGSNPIRLRSSRAEGLAPDINRAAVRCAREGGGHLPVAGDMGPTGEMLIPTGHLSADEARGAFRAQAEHLAQAGVDLFIIETFFNLEEALCALRAVRDVCSLPVWVSLTFRRTPRGFFTVYGNAPLPSLTRLLEEGAEKAGANCTLASADMALLAEEIVPSLGECAFLQPNAGEPQAVDGALSYPESPAQFAEAMTRIVALHPGAVGGCCGTTPDHIKAVAAVIRRRST